MKSFTSTYTFSLLDKAYNVKSLIKQIKDKTTPISKEIMKSTMDTIDHLINMPIKKLVLNEYNSGNIILYTRNNDFVFPSTIPVLLRKTETGIVSTIDVTNYITMTKDQFGDVSEVKVNEKRLFALMCTAWLYRHWFLDTESCSANSKLVVMAATSYAKMVYKVLDRSYSVGVNYSSIDKTYTLLAQYFMHSIIETKYAVDLAPTITCIDDKNSAYAYAKEFEKNITRWGDLRDLINYLNVNIPNLGKVDVKHFISEFARIWGPSSIVATEYFPYFFMLLISASIGAGIGEDVKINSLIKKDIDNIILLLGEIYK